jgi:hypothetical protein
LFPVELDSREVKELRVRQAVLAGKHVTGASEQRERLDSRERLELEA